MGCVVEIQKVYFCPCVPCFFSVFGGEFSASAATVNLSPTSLSFSSQAVGTITRAIRTLPTPVPSIISFGRRTISGDFTWVAWGTCGSSLAVNSSCTMSIKFKPTSREPRTGSSRSVTRQRQPASRNLYRHGHNRRLSGVTVKLSPTS